MVEKISENSSYRSKLHFIVGERVEADDGKILVSCRRTVWSHCPHHDPAIGNVQVLKAFRDEQGGIGMLVCHDLRRNHARHRNGIGSG